MADICQCEWKPRTDKFGVHFGYRFSGPPVLYMYIPDPGFHNYLQYTLDGVYQKRIKISGDNHQALSITGLSNGSHTIWIYKATEAQTGPIFIEKIIAHDITAMKDPESAID